MFFTALALATAFPPRPMTAEVTRDPITDLVRATAVLDDNRNRLIVSCDPSRFDGLRVTLHYTTWFDRGGLIAGVRPMTYRFDSNPPQRMGWYVQEDTATMKGRRRVDRFLQWLTVSERLVIRTRDIEDRPVDLTFRIQGAEPAIAQVREACTRSPRRRWWWPVLGRRND